MCRTRVDSCWLVLDSCWFGLTRVRLVLIRVDSYWLVLTQADLCWQLCIRIDLIKKNKAKIKYLKKQKSFWRQMKNNFHHFKRSFSCQKFPTRCNGSLSNFFPKYRIQFIKVHKIYFRCVAMALKLQQYTCYSLKKVVKYKNLGEIYIFNVNISANPFQLFSM